MRATSLLEDVISVRIRAASPGLAVAQWQSAYVAFADFDLWTTTSYAPPGALDNLGYFIWRKHRTVRFDLGRICIGGARCDSNGFINVSRVQAPPDQRKPAGSSDGRAIDNQPAANPDLGHHQHVLPSQ